MSIKNVDSGKFHGNFVIISQYFHLWHCLEYITMIWGIYYFTFPQEIIVIFLQYWQYFIDTDRQSEVWTWYLLA